MYYITYCKFEGRGYFVWGASTSVHKSIKDADIALMEFYGIDALSRIFNWLSKASYKNVTKVLLDELRPILRLNTVECSKEVYTLAKEGNGVVPMVIVNDKARLKKSKKSYTE